MLKVRAIVLVLMAGACLSPVAQSQPNAPISMHTIPEGKLYWMDGAGGNSGIIIGATGVIVIDAKITAEARQSHR